MKLTLIKSISIIFFFIILGCWIYSNTLEAPFAYDDSHIYDNPYIRISKLSEIGNVGFKSSLTRPVAYISFALNYYFHQYDLFGYHLVNIIIHILTGTFLFLFIKTTLGLPLFRAQYQNPDAIAAATALVWLAHPLHTQSVTYIVQRMNSMAAMFFILSLLLYAKGRLIQQQSSTDQQPDSGAKRKAQSAKTVLKNRKSAFSIRGSIPLIYFAGAALSWVLSLGCKQTSVTLPFFILLYEWYFFQDLDRSWIKHRLKYLLGILLLFGLIAFIYLGSDPLQRLTAINDFANKEFTYSERVLSQFRVIMYYLSLIFYPHPSRLNLIYDFPLSRSLLNPITTLFSLSAIIGLLGFAVFIARKHRLISFCILWFFGNLVIESSVIPLAVIFEHRTYLPSMLVVLAAVTLIYRYINPKWLGIVLLCPILAICSVWTYQRNAVWKDGVTLWQDNVEKSPNKYLPHYNLGNALSKTGKTDEAIFHYSEALRLNPDYVKAHINMGNSLVAVDRSDEAIAHFREAFRLDPENSNAHNNLGIELSKQGRVTEAIQHFSRAAQLDPGNASARNNLDRATLVKKQIEAAIAETEYQLKLYPDNPGLYYTLGNLYKSMGEFKTAIRHYRKALSIQPDFIPAANNLAVVYLKVSDPDKALAVFKKIAELEPDNAAAYYNIACVHARLNRAEPAVDWLRKAIDRGYDNWELIQTDRDLENIRSSSGYKELIRGR